MQTTTDREQLINRFSELSLRAERTGTPQETRFLSIAEQAELDALRIPCEYFGGYGGAERRIAVFGAGEGYEPPIVCLAIRPLSRKFSDELTHRDFLGSLMALGITRDVLGDIVVSDNTGYLFALERIAPFIAENLTEVRRTAVSAEPAELPDSVVNGGEEISVVVASERLDALVAAVYRLSRDDAKALAEKGLVFVDSRLVMKAGASVPEGARVSVRGRGRFVYLGIERETRKGKLRARVRVGS